MTRFSTACFLASLLALTACSSLPYGNETRVVRFALRDDNIVSWQEKDDGIAVRLTEDGQRKIASITRENPGAELEVYVCRTLVATSTVHRTLRGMNVYFSVDGDRIEAVEALLPQPKKA